MNRFILSVISLCVTMSESLAAALFPRRRPHAAHARAVIRHDLLLMSLIEKAPVPHTDKPR